MKSPQSLGTVPARTSPACAHTDGARLARLRAGDEDACEELLRQHGGRLLACAQRLLADEREAAAALAEAFLAAFRALEGGAGPAELGPWLQGLVLDACLARVRASAPSRTALAGLLPAFDARGNHRGGVRPPAPRAALARHELQAEVSRCIAGLPSGHRAALLLCDVERLTHPEVAERLGLTRAALEARVREARQALRTLLVPALEAAGRASEERG